MIVGVFMHFKIQANVRRFVFLIFFLSNVVLSVTSATEIQCNDSRYTSSLSVIKIIPFIDHQHITCVSDTEGFLDRVRQPLVAAVAKHASWVGDQKDELINQSFSQITTSAGTVKTDELIFTIADHVVDEISKLRALKLTELTDATTEHTFPVPLKAHFINVGRIIAGQVSAGENCTDIEQFGFRRYLRYPKKESTYRPSEFNYGSTFVYPTQIELQQLGIAHPFGLLTDQHRVITNAVSDYGEKNYDGENVLFVNIFVRVNEIIIHRISCGMFISGTGQPASQPIKDIFGGTNSVKLKLLQSNWKDIEPFTSGVMPQKIEDLTIYRKCYEKKPFLHPHGNRRFPPVSGATYKILPQIKAILGSWPDQPSKDNVSPELAMRIELLYGESPVSSRVDIYGENELKGVLRSQGAFGTCFHQSEQHFVALMDSSPIEIGQLGDHLHVDRYVNSLPTVSDENKSDNVANNIVVCCYNRRDMCRYCRATFSYMMSNDLIKQKVCAFVDKMFDDTVFAQSYESIPIQIYAFSKETTEL